MIIKAALHREVMKRLLRGGPPLYLGALPLDEAQLVSVDYSHATGLVTLFFDVDDNSDDVIELPTRMP